MSTRGIISRHLSWLIFLVGSLLLMFFIDVRSPEKANAQVVVTLVKSPPVLVTKLPTQFFPSPVFTQTNTKQSINPILLTNIQSIRLADKTIQLSASMQFVNFRAGLTVNKPESMQINESVIVSLIIKPGVVTENLPIEAELQGVNFRVAPSGRQIQYAVVNKELTWNWSVAPNSTGQQALTLDVVINQNGQIYRLNSFAIEIVVYSPTDEPTFTPSTTSTLTETPTWIPSPIFSPTETWSPSPVSTWTPSPTQEPVPTEKPGSWLTAEVAAIIVALIGLIGGLIKLIFDNSKSKKEKNRGE